MTKLNLEMGNTAQIVDVALRIKPEEVCLVPEKLAVRGYGGPVCDGGHARS